MSILELGEHGGGEAGMLAEIDERNFLAKAKLPELAPDLVSGEYPGDRLLATFGWLNFHISCTEIIIFYFSHAEHIIGWQLKFRLFPVTLPSRYRLD